MVDRDIATSDLYAQGHESLPHHLPEASPPDINPMEGTGFCVGHSRGHHPVHSIAIVKILVEMGTRKTLAGEITRYTMHPSRHMPFGQ